MMPRAEKQLRAKLEKMTRKLYDPKTPRAVRSDLSLEVSCIREQLGHRFESMLSASIETEVGS